MALVSDTFLGLGESPHVHFVPTMRVVTFLTKLMPKGINLSTVRQLVNRGVEMGNHKPWPPGSWAQREQGQRKHSGGRWAPGFTLHLQHGGRTVKLVLGPGSLPEAPPSLGKWIINQSPCCEISEADWAPAVVLLRAAFLHVNILPPHCSLEVFFSLLYFFFRFCLKLIPQHWITFPHKVGVNQAEFIKIFTIKWAHSRRRKVTLLSHFKSLNNFSP